MSPSSKRSRSRFEPAKRSEIAGLWLEKFGVLPDAFADSSFFWRAKNVWAFSNTELPKLSFETVGLRIMSFRDEPWKPTTCALQIFGRYATKNLVHLSSDEARAFLAGESQPIQAGVDPGYVVVFYRGDVLGCALYSRGRLISQLPKERRIACLKEIDI